MEEKNRAFDYDTARFALWCDPEDVTPYERNAKKHDDKQVENIANSIRRFGWQQDCVVTRDRVLVIGHGRRLAAIRLGCKLPYHVIDKDADQLTDEDIRAARLADNKTNESGWDFGALDTELAELACSLDMREYGFEITNEDGFEENFELDSGERNSGCVMTFSLAIEQAEAVKRALKEVKGVETETFGNKNSNGNALYEVIRQWEAQRK